MRPEALARLHAACFETPRPWSAAEFASLMDGPGAILIAEADGFVLGRALAGEAEILTIAVRPTARRKGIGARLVADFIAAARDAGAGTVFLEVAADNTAARGLYHATGFVEAGRRRAYYRTPQGDAVDALVLRYGLTQGQPEI
jgi:ribosomal-protein-alanine N-acetyltransferase